jgi:flagellin
MSLGILNNIAALYAENNLNSTQASLQTTLQQLSSGSRINSGADDPAGLAVSDGLGANEAALTQSSQNASDGIGLLQTADGALSQVTSLLDQAVTLATESANGTLTSGQVSSANQEYQNILGQIGNIGSTTNFNSTNVFSSTATNIVVTDGTSSGLNTYADTVGALTTGSVGTSAGTAVVSTTLTPVTTQPVAGSSKVAGKYTFTPTAKTDTLSGQLSLTVGAGTELDVTVAPGTTTGQLQTQLMANSSFTGAGLSASVTASTGALVITGPTSGANAAANTVAFTNTALTDTLTPPAITGAAGVAASIGTAAKGSLAVTGAQAADDLSGTITLTQGSQTLAITIAANSTFGDAATTGTVENQIATAIAAQTTTSFAVAAETGTAANPTLNFTGANNATAGGVTITNTLTDATTTTGVSYTATGTVGTAPKAGTYALSAMSTATDTYGTGSILSIGSEAITLDGLTGAAAATAITSDAAMTSAGITAAFNAGTKVLTITGNVDGTALPSVTGVSNLTDLSSVAPTNVTTVATTTAASGTTAIPAGTSVISLANSGDTLSGTLNVAVAGGKTGAITIKAGTSGSALATQITNDASFKAASITAAYNAGTNAVTLTGPTGATDALTVTGTVTDSTVSVPGAGANFTAGTVSQLTAATAATVLTTVTSAVADVAYQRGTIGADVNELTSASNVANAESVNLTSAQDTINATDYGQAASNLSKYQILSQTGISALAQANSVQQEVLKLLQ